MAGKIGSGGRGGRAEDMDCLDVIVDKAAAGRATNAISRCPARPLSRRAPNASAGIAKVCTNVGAKVCAKVCVCVCVCVLL